jgi:hypothetical protein
MSVEDRDGTTVSWCSSKSRTTVEGASADTLNGAFALQLCKSWTPACLKTACLQLIAHLPLSMHPAVTRGERSWTEETKASVAALERSSRTHTDGCMKLFLKFHRFPKVNICQDEDEAVGAWLLLAGWAGWLLAVLAGLAAWLPN